MASKAAAPTVALGDLSARRIIILSFWAISLLGLPFWWYSTTIERLALPSAQIAAWKARQPCMLRPSIGVRLSQSMEVRESQATQQGLWNELRDVPAARCLAIGGRGADNYELLVVDSAPAVELEGWRAVIPARGASDQTLLEVAQTLLDMVATGIDARVAKYSPRYKLVFSLLNEDSSSGSALLEWDIQALLKLHLQPLLTSLAPLHSFEIETQIHYFAPLSIDLAKEGNEFVVREDDLRAFVNSADWNLPTSVTLDPVLHFMLFVPSLAHRPMQISTSKRHNSVNAFITPQRGGVVIFNPPAPSPNESDLSSISSPPPSDLGPSFQLFEQQLRKLLGVPQAPATARLRRSGSAEPWQVDAMVRSRLAEATKESVDTLHAITKLVEDIPNMRVGKDVQRGVMSSLRELELAEYTLVTSTSRALEHASAALALASKAYYDPTMLALLYFPQEHKYAIYSPLFGPVAVPMLVALLKEYKEWKEKRRRDREVREEAEEESSSTDQEDQQLQEEKEKQE